MTAFETLCKAGQAAAIAGDWQQAHDEFLEAEALWRDAPFANIPSKKLREAHAPHLEQLFVTARQSRIEASVRLSLRACDAAAHELARLAEEHPERERLRWLLMLALYRAGRRHDAQNAFLEYRKHSVQEFGVEPGEDIQHLNNRIHGSDPGLLHEPLT
jgi:DNA-binding SARP family transcriptional activator